MDKKGKKWKRGWNRWVKSRPVCVQKLIKKFPPGSVVILDDVPHYLLGYTEGDMLILSKIHPVEDYAGARANTIYVCAHHLEAAH